MGCTAGEDNRAPAGSRPVALQRLDGVVRVAAATTMTRTSAVVGARDQTSDRPPRTDRAQPPESSSRGDCSVRIGGNTFVVIDPGQFRWRTVLLGSSSTSLSEAAASEEDQPCPVAPAAAARRLGGRCWSRARLRIPRGAGRAVVRSRCSAYRERGSLRRLRVAEGAVSPHHGYRWIAARAGASGDKGFGSRRCARSWGVGKG